MNAKQVQQGVQAEAPETTTWPKGHRLQGTHGKEYEILKTLAQGGFGVTYKAKIWNTRQFVVIKAVKRLSNYDPSKHSQDFVGEFQMLMKLQGIPHVVQPIDLIYDDGRQLPALVLEWVEGDPLRPLFSPEAAIVCMKQVGQALTQAHAKGIIHRDIKPANLLRRKCPDGELEGELEIVVVDWGAARNFMESDSLTAFSSQWYSAPEVRANLKEDSRSDLYSLCVTFYELITGWSLQGWKPDTLLPEPEGLDQGLWEIFAKGLAVQKEDRYDSVEQLLQALEHWVRRSEVVLPESVTAALKDPRSQSAGPASSQSKLRSVVFQVTGLASLSVVSVVLGAWLFSLYFDFGKNPGPVSTPTSATTSNNAPVDVPSVAPRPTPPPTSQTQHLGIPVEPYSYTTARVSQTGEVTTYEATAPIGRYVERELDLPAGAVELAMVAIPGGSFTMGQTETEKAQLIEKFGQDIYDESFDDEEPRQVTVPDFFIGQNEVTQAQWFAVMGRDYNVKNWQDNWDRIDSQRFKGENRSILNISWEDATEFARRLSQLTGRTYRLPTEAEWEYATRAGTTTPFAHGSHPIRSEDSSYSNSLEQFGSAAPIAGSMLYPNPWGLLNVHGNVWEWVQDEYRESYEGLLSDLMQDSSIALAKDAGMLDNDLMVLRGGTWSYKPRGLRLTMNTRSADRLGSLSGDRFVGYGFRVALE